MKPDGRANPISVVLLLAMAAGFYWVFLFGSVYWDNVKVGEVVRSAFLMASRSDEHTVRRFIEGELSRVGTHLEVDEQGGLREAAGLVLTDDQIRVERIENTVRVQVRYHRDVKLFPLSRWVKVRFNSSKEGPVTP